MKRSGGAIPPEAVGDECGHQRYRVFHDIIEWAIANGYKRFYSGSLNYDPKWHLRHSLYPIDLYARHTSDPDSSGCFR